MQRKFTAEALQFEIFDGVKSRTVLIGHIAADELDQISGVPAFSDRTDQATIARNISGTPIKDWQRPLEPEKRDAIARRFSQAGEFMPNPVLLAVHDKGAVKISPKVAGNQVTSVRNIEVELANEGDPPLWILDGQHRVRGISISDRPSSPIPFVLLHGDSPGYIEADFAKVFAEVSTKASPLDSLHKDWLQFAFKLGPYGEEPARSEKRVKAMQTVALLTSEQTLGADMVVNPYYDKIRLNPKSLNVPAVYGAGFRFDAATLKQLIEKHYFAKPNSNMTPEELARQIALATRALMDVVTTDIDSSGFSGIGTNHHKYLEEAFLVGTFSRLLKSESVVWTDLLKTLKFHDTNWHFTWAGARTGKQGTLSKRAAENVFKQIFQDGTLPGRTSNVSTYLRGDGASIELQARKVGASGTPIPSDSVKIKLELSGHKEFNTSGRDFVRLIATSVTKNIAKLEVVNTASPLEQVLTTATLKKGLRLSEIGSSEWLFRAEFYGGTSSEMTLSIT